MQHLASIFDDIGLPTNLLVSFLEIMNVYVPNSSKNLTNSDSKAKVEFHYELLLCSQLSFEDPQMDKLYRETNEAMFEV